MPAARRRKRTAVVRRRTLSVVEAVKRDIVDLGDEKLAKSGLAASALALAVEIDDRGNSATSKSMCARSLLETLDRLRALAPSSDERDQLDAIGSRRAARRAGRAGT